MTNMSRQLNEDLLLLFCEKNSDGTRHLRLKGRELYQRLGIRINKEHVELLANFLKKYEKIISMDLCYNSLGDEGLQLLTETYFSQENNLRYLNLMHNDITEKGLKYLSSSKFLKLQSCRLNGNKLGMNGGKSIADLILNCSTLTSLDIAETDQTQISISSVLYIIEHSSLTSLNISRIIPHSYYSQYNAADLADDLSIMLTSNKNLTELHIQKCELDGHDMGILLYGLRENKSLLFLDLGCNRIGNHGAELLSKWLRTGPILRALNISSNGIRNTGAMALSYSLPFSQVRLLDISSNHIKDYGMQNLLNTLKKPCVMRMLFFWGNNFGPKTNKIIERCLESGVLEQEYIDVKVYRVDDVPLAAYYPSNHYKHRYYHVLDYGWPPELKIHRNEITTSDSMPRALLELENTPRYPPLRQ